jgi:hypothetical protein
LTCDAGEFRIGCSGVSQGECKSCLNYLPTCPVGFYRTGCEGLNAGNCDGRCTNAASDEYYTSNGHLSGTCGVEKCPSCPSGQYRVNCVGQVANSDGSAPGNCITCETLNVGEYFNPPCLGVSSGMFFFSICECESFEREACDAV